MEERRIDNEIRLIPYYRNDEASLPWYQDPDICRQVDNRTEPYDLRLLHGMYDYLCSHGECYYIEYKGKLVGDVSLRDNSEIAVVVCKEYQNRHIGRRCVREMLKLAAEKGMDHVMANIYSFNEQSWHMFETAGFYRTDEEWYRYDLSEVQEVRGENTMVEKADINDTDALVKMRLDYLQEDNGFLDEQDVTAIKTDLPDYYKDHLNNDLFVYVIRDGQQIVSCAFLLVVLKPMSPSFINGRTGTILNVYTCPQYRRRGYAKKIMEALLNDAEKMQLSIIELKATEDGYPLYRSVGFADDNSGYHLMKWRNR